MEAKTYYFVGIGGIGMSAIARYLKNNGHKVYGYDRTQTLLTSELENEGMIITKPDLSEFAQKTKTVLNMFSEIYGKKLMEIVMSFK